MRVHQVGHDSPAARRAPTSAADARQGGEAQRVVRPVPPVRVRDTDCPAARYRCGASSTSRSRPAARPLPAAAPGRRTDRRSVHRLRRVLERRQHRGIARQQRADRDALRRQRGRQRAGDVGEPAGLDQRIDLRGDGQDAERRHASRRSIIGWVIRQMPFSVRRKRLRVEHRVLAHHQPVGDAHAAVDHHVAQPRVPADIDIRQDHRVVDVGVGMHVHAGEQQRAAQRRARDDAAAGRPARRSPRRAGRPRRARTSPAA